MKNFKPLNFLYNFVIVFLALTLFSNASAQTVTITSTVTAFASGTLLSCVPTFGLTMAIQKEIWNGHLIKNFWRDNAFAKAAMQCLDDYIYGGKVVHQTKVNGRPEVVRNLNVFPAAPTERIDIDITYPIDEFFVKPWRIKQADKYELDYDKRENMMGEQSAAANQEAADWLLRHWFKYVQTNRDNTTYTEEAQKIRTSGEVAAATIGTGTRKMLAVKDFKKAKVLMNKNNVLKTERYAVVDSEMLDQLTQDPEYKRAERIYEKELVEGSVAKVQGFNIFERSKVLELNAAGTDLLAHNAVAGATDNAACLLWQKNGVETAMGGIDWFDDQGNPLYYGDVFSCILRASGRIRRSDSVVSIIQTT